MRYAMVPIAVGLLCSAHAGSGLAQGPGYVLGAEDVVVVTVIDQPKFSGEYLIPESGAIVIPVVGEVKAAGMTLDQLRDATLAGLKKRLVHPEVAVVLKTPRPKRLYVFGDVQKPGILDWKPGWRIQEALGAAGGLVTGVQQNDVQVILERANTKERMAMPLLQALNGDVSKMFLDPGDVLRIETAAMTPIYVAGKVKSPGIYRLRENEAGVLEALAQAGGTTDDANITSVRVVHLNGTDEVFNLAPALLDGKKIDLPRLKTGDMIMVSESQARFAVLGYVKAPGYFAIPSGKTVTLSQAIAMAGGAGANGRITRIGLARTENGKEVRQVIDLGKFLQKGDAASNPELKPGDVLYVPESNRVDLGKILSSVAAGALLFNRIR